MTSSDWFNDARYGMFIHWGAYSVAARGEWTLNRERIPFEEYTEKYVRNFRAEKYDPSAWARLAKDGGMKYVVLTTRHHDGFALWDTRTNDYNSARLGPCRDLVAEYVEAVRNEGLRVGFYYSVADWHHPDYPDAYARASEGVRRIVSHWWSAVKRSSPCPFPAPLPAIATARSFRRALGAQFAP